MAGCGLLSFGQAPGRENSWLKEVGIYTFLLLHKSRRDASKLRGMADEKDSNAGAWSRVPTWDGSPQTWRSFRKDIMSWWLAGLDIQSTKKYNLAARWLLQQSGVVRQRGEEFDPAELEYQKEVKMPNAETGDDEIVTPEDPLSGINRLLRALEEMTGRTSLDKRGELRNVFYLELKRRSGERISEFATRFRGLIAEMKSEGGEVAKLAMTRLQFSRGLRKAELARSRSTTMEAAPTPGSICYFYRPLRYNNKMSQSQKKLTLKRWHGPAMMVAMDGHASVFLSYKGQLTKCALEHVRLASTMEQIASGAWSEAIKEAVDAARHEQALRNPQSDGNQGWQAPQQPVLPETPVAAGNPSTPAFLPPSNATMNADDNQLEGRDLPPVQPQELWQMMVPSNAHASSQVDSSLPSRRASDFSDTPFPQATRLAMGRRPSGLPLTSVCERVREIEGSFKRPAELDAEALREQGHEQGTPRAEASSSMPAEVDEALVTEAVDVIQTELKKENLHLQAELDKKSPLDAEVPDHGTWHGKWSLPSRSEWLAHQKLGLSWPNGSQPDHEVQAVQANRKEFRWKSMTGEEKKAFAEAAAQAWSVWEENAAIEVLAPEESERVRRRLLANKEGSKILTPRYVFTDRHEGLRTALNPLPLKARAGVIAPGYKDIFSYNLRKDAPTGSRVSQHLLFTFTASNSTSTTPQELKWKIMSADGKSAFLKGDAYVDGQRELFLENVKGEEPKLPFGSCLAKIRKGVFGLSDAPRQWYLRLNKSLQAAGWERTVFDFACWLKWSDDRKKLRGIIISHVDDLLLGGDTTAQESLLTIGKELGFGSVEYDDFVYCGKRIQMKPDGSITRPTTTTSRPWRFL